MFRAIVSAMTRRHMDLSLRTDGGGRVRIVERPGLWMAAPELAALQADLQTVARKVLGPVALDYGVFRKDGSALDRSVLTVAYSPHGTPVAFNALAVMEVVVPPYPVEVLHLGLVMVDPDERSKSLSWVLYGLTCFLIFLRARCRPVWVSSVSQVPAVVGMVAGMFSDVWPAPPPARRGLTHLLLARAIMAAHRPVFGVGPEAGFDEDQFVITAAYSGGSDALKKTFDQATPHRSDAVNAMCRAGLDYDRGDDFLQLGRMDLAAMRRFLAEEVPKGAWVSLFLAAGLLALQRAVLPLVQWFDPSVPYGILRPRVGGRR